MTNCRIGSYQLKSGGAKVRILPMPERNQFHRTVETAGRLIDSDTHAMGFFILYKDGLVSSGVSYDEGFTQSQLKGACEHMKDCLIDQVWGEDE